MPQSAPPPDLRIVPTDSLFPHETHDPQRSAPLVARIQSDEFIINPPIVAPVDANRFVILDGANRCHSFRALGYPHILVQVVTYESGYIDLKTWKHVISNWEIGELIDQLKRFDDVEIHDGQDKDAIAHIIMRHGQVLALRAPISNTHERNAVLRHVVDIYQQNATLNRTALAEPQDIWLLFPDAIALAVFPDYTPLDIVSAAKYNAYLPPGISRHIIHGRALRVNYPMSILRDENTRLLTKNENLKAWMQAKMANRQVRYYAEATYQFDE